MNNLNEKMIEKIATNIVSKAVCAMAKIFDDSGYSFVFFSMDLQEPLHVHVKKENKKAKFWIQDDKYGKQDIVDWVHGCKCQNDGGFKPHELNQIMEIIEKRKGEIVEKWESSLPDDSKLKQSNVAIMNRVYVESVREDGFDLFINGKKIFVSFDKLPIFKDVQIQDIFNVNFFGEDALEWEDADIHIYIDTLIHP